MEYDSYLNLSKVTLPDGSFSTWEYDQRGNCLTAKNPLGAVETYKYDNLNRMIGENWQMETKSSLLMMPMIMYFAQKIEKHRWNLHILIGKYSFKKAG